VEISLAALAPLLLLAVGFVVYCLVDLARSPDVHGLPRWAWGILIVVTIPLGGIIYLLVGRRP
jgi:hypothetical protein